MSFIYDDKKLLDNLIKSAIDFEVKFNKNGQLAANPNVNMEYRNYLTLTQKLVDQLSQQVSPTTPNKDPNAPATLLAAQNAPMKISDVVSLGNFFDYTIKNGITVDGQRPVYGANETGFDPKYWKPVDAEQS